MEIRKELQSLIDRIENIESKIREQENEILEIKTRNFTDNLADDVETEINAENNEKNKLKIKKNESQRYKTEINKKKDGSVVMHFYYLMKKVLLKWMIGNFFF